MPRFEGGKCVDADGWEVRIVNQPRATKAVEVAVETASCMWCGEATTVYMTRVEAPEPKDLFFVACENYDCLAAGPQCSTAMEAATWWNKWVTHARKIKDKTFTDEDSPRCPDAFMARYGDVYYEPVPHVLPCPWCGAEDPKVFNHQEPSPGDYPHVQCQKCRGIGPLAQDMPDGIRYWNRGARCGLSRGEATS